MQYTTQNSSPGFASTRGVLCTLAAILVGVFASGAFSQPQPSPRDPEYIITRWETDEGLPDSSATAMVQDAQGYLWIGTFRGLARFDGVQFVLFDPANTPELPRPEVVSLHVDRHSRGAHDVLRRTMAARV